MLADKKQKKTYTKTLVDPADLSPKVLKFIKSLMKRAGRPAPVSDGMVFCIDCILRLKVVKYLEDGVCAIVKDDHGNFIEETSVPLVELKNDGYILTKFGLSLAKRIQYYYIPGL